MKMQQILTWDATWRREGVNDCSNSSSTLSSLTPSSTQLKTRSQLDVQVEVYETLMTTTSVPHGCYSRQLSCSLGQFLIVVSFCTFVFLLWVVLRFGLLTLMLTLLTLRLLQAPVFAWQILWEFWLFSSFMFITITTNTTWVEKGFIYIPGPYGKAASETLSLWGSHHSHSSWVNYLLIS